MRMYDKDNRKLIYFEESATPDFWDNHWDKEYFKEHVEKGEDNRIVLKTGINISLTKEGIFWKVDVV